MDIRGIPFTEEQRAAREAFLKARSERTISEIVQEIRAERRARQIALLKRILRGR